MEQEVKNLKVGDLVLWTENPRDPIDQTASNQDITARAFEDRSSKWKLNNLADKMGEIYDFSELPTVVFHGKTPVVYDGNRRMILAMLKLELVTAEGFDISKIPIVPETIPCNVCKKDIALKNILRKHSDSGSWLPLDRDIFLHKHLGQKKSPFLILEEQTQIISKNPHMNKGFVKKELFKESQLKKLGFNTDNGKLRTLHDDKEATKILSNISEKIREKRLPLVSHEVSLLAF